MAEDDCEAAIIVVAAVKAGLAMKGGDDTKLGDEAVKLLDPAVKLVGAAVNPEEVVLVGGSE